MKAGFLDIGSNSLRFMTGEKTGAGYTFSEKQVYTTRLAEGLVQTGRLSSRRIEQSLAVIEALCQQCAEERIPVYAYATSAVRDAENRSALTDPVMALTSGRLFVLSGAEEAENAYLAATGGSGGMLDIGGGSTQIITDRFKKSYPMGCVRAKDLCASDDFASMRARLRPALDKVFSIPTLPPMGWTGVGGTITTLCASEQGLTAYDRTRVQGASMTREAIESTLTRQALLGDGRRNEPLLAKRHDVILQGGAILLYVLERIGATVLRISDRDGLEGFARKTLDQGVAAP